ncbi:MAG: hypothetical protein SCK28_09920 [Bacillota bacterium]|nr:hypothetical protein [Bacillota bacterium]
MKFYFITKNRARLIVSFLIGMLLGASIVTWWVGARIDYLMLQNEKLQATLDSKETQIKNLEDNLASKQRFVVKDIQVVVSFSDEKEEDSFVQLTLERKVIEMLDDLWGKEVNTLDPTLIYNIVHNRTVEVESISYHLKVTRGPLISDKVLIHIDASTKSEDDDSN